MKTLLVMVMVLGMGFFAVNAEAFCIYNRSDTRIKFSQTRGGMDLYFPFAGELGPGEKQCCNWKTKRCNYEGKRYAKVAFDIFVKSANSAGKYTLMCKDITIPAGGYIEVKGEKGLYRCEAHGY